MLPVQVEVTPSFAKAAVVAGASWRQVAAVAEQRPLARTAAFLQQGLLLVVAVELDQLQRVASEPPREQQEMEHS